MLNELESMKNNQVWELVEPHKSQKLVGSKWIFKTKKDKDGRIERLKARLVAKGFTQREGIDYTEMFSPVSTKDYFRIIMALVVHYDLLLHQMDVKITFLSRELEEENFVRQPEEFTKEGKEHMVCKLDKAIYGLKQKVSLAKGDLKKEHCPKNQEEEDEMRNKPYASLVGGIIHTKNLELVSYADVNLGKAKDDYIFTSGFLLKIVEAVVASKNAKQFGVSSSTMFSEYIAYYEATSHAVW
ncbi:hypothetical protein L3X38_032422 [Prunus dulcis]|uniref:Reverse transcriptase Ty1/copia-type domain-containing protein n=1 Tax=Prunus dulcis TaxID=3755 RepID=A0AAD4YVW9_PRUDU|nr:hypothetical protein L3X38_032422 [Prunus dulcis]